MELSGPGNVGRVFPMNCYWVAGGERFATLEEAVSWVGQYLGGNATISHYPEGASLNGQRIMGMVTSWEVLISAEPQPRVS